MASGHFSRKMTCRNILLSIIVLWGLNSDFVNLVDGCKMLCFLGKILKYSFVCQWHSVVGGGGSWWRFRPGASCRLPVTWISIFPSGPITENVTLLYYTRRGGPCVSRVSAGCWWWWFVPCRGFKRSIRACLCFSSSCVCLAKMSMDIFITVATLPRAASSSFKDLDEPDSCPSRVSADFYDSYEGHCNINEHFML